MAVEAVEQQEVADVGEEVEADSDGDSDTDSPSEGSSSEGSDSHSDSSSNKKQKKKKKKKKKKAGGGGNGEAAPPAIDPAARKEGERRFQEAVDQLAHNSEDSMWVKLNGCYLADGKMKKLCEALKANSTVISLDLSDNHLTDEGAKALAAALQDGRAPDLIDLDLKDNPIRDAGAAALEELQQHRKTLRVALGTSQPPSPPAQQQHGAAAGGAKQQQQQNGSAGGSGNGSPSSGSGGAGSLADTVKNNPVISKYFQVGNDEAEAEEQKQQGGGSQQQQAEEGQQHLGGLSEAELAHILWDQLEQCLDAPRPDIPAVSEPLRAIAEQVEHEMDNCALPLLPSTEMHELRTFTKWALRKLQVMHSVLDLVPPPILTPYSKKTPVPAVGTHRTAVAELLAQLLRAECPVVAQAVAASGVLRRCAVVAVDHPNCSAIHGAVGRCLKLSLSKPMGHVGLWRQLLGSAPAAARAGAGSIDQGGSLNLAVEAASIAASAEAAPSVGKRAANVGFALAIAQLLHAAATGEVLGANARAADAGASGLPPGAVPSGITAADLAPGGRGDGAGSTASTTGNGPAAAKPDAATPPSAAAAVAAAAAGGGDPASEEPHSSGGGAPMVSTAGAVRTPLGREEEPWERQLQAQLAEAEAWVEFTSGEGCLLRRLLGEHQGDLGGPRPRQGGEPENGSGDEGDVSPGQIISGQELLMMLRGLNLGGFSGGM